jgi:hypothetical protein
VLDEIRAAGGEVFAITSEPKSLATEAEEDWNIGFPAVGDPHHEIRETCRDRDLIDIYFNENYGHLRNRPWASHPKAYYQPGVLALSQPGRVIYRWRCRPTRDNMSGAGARPTPAYSWDAMRARLSDAVEPALDESPEFGFKDFSWLAFLTIGLAHGWFVRPKMFPLGRPEDNASANQHKMMSRVYWFIGAWFVALLLLPIMWVAIAFLLWCVIIIPGLVEFHQQMQHESEPG